MSRRTVAVVALGIIGLAAALVVAVLMDRVQRNRALRERATVACARIGQAIGTPSVRELLGGDEAMVNEALRSMLNSRCEALVAQLVPMGSTDAPFHAPPNPPAQVHTVNQAIERVRPRCLKRMRALADSFDLTDQKRAELERACELEGLQPLPEQPRQLTLSEAVEAIEGYADRLDSAGSDAPAPLDISVTVPVRDVAADEATPTVSLRLTSEGVQLDGEPIDSRGIVQRLREQSGNARVVITTGEGASHEQVLELVDHLRSHGIERLAINAPEPLD